MAHPTTERIDNIGMTVSLGGHKGLSSSRNNQEPSKKWVFSPRVLSRWMESARILGRQ